MLTIGLTGGIGSGKSTVAKMLEQLGAVLVDADRIGWQAYRAGTPGFGAVVDEFGDQVVGADNEIDRAKLGAIVFGDPAIMTALTDIVWPIIAGAIGERIKVEADRGTATLVVEAAVLLEARWERLFDEIWVVTAPKESVRERLTSRDGASDAAIAQRLAAQLTDEERIGRADVVIDNGGDLGALRRTVECVWKRRTEGKCA